MTNRKIDHEHLCQDRRRDATTGDAPRRSGHIGQHDLIAGVDVTASLDAPPAGRDAVDLVSRARGFTLLVDGAQFFDVLANSRYTVVTEGDLKGRFG